MQEIGIALKDDKRITNFSRLLKSHLVEWFQTPVEVACDSSRVYITRAMSQNGSLRDMLFGADPIVSSVKKFKSKGKPFSLADIATYGKQMLLTIKAMHTFNLPCPHAHLGNWFVTEGNRIELSDTESVLLGITRLPAIQPFDEDGAPTATTHIDLLLFGINLIEMFLGCPLSAAKEQQLLSIQGDPTNFLEEEEEEKKEANAAATMAFLDALQCKSPDFINILKYIFHHENCADIDTLLKHSFFATAKFKAPLKALEASTYVEHPQLKLKVKDIDMFSECSRNWASYLQGAEEKRQRMQKSKEQLKEMKKNKKAPKSKDTPALAIAPPPVAASPPTQVTAAAPVASQSAPSTAPAPPGKLAPPPPKAPPPTGQAPPPPPSKAPPAPPPPPGKAPPAPAPPPGKAPPPPPGKAPPPPPPPPGKKAPPPPPPPPPKK